MQVRQQTEQQSFALEIEGTIIDISKFTVAQLITLAEAQELGVQKGAQRRRMRSVSEFAMHTGKK